MEDKLKSAGAIYDKTEIPDQLNQIIIDKIRSTKPQRKAILIIKNCFIALILAIGVLLIGVNTSPVFASSLYDIPIAGDIARLFTIREYNIQGSFIDIKGQIPQVSGLADKRLEQEINEGISKRIDALVAQAEKDARELEKKYTASETQDGYIPVNYTFSYDLKCSNQQYFSFVVNIEQTWANVFTEQIFYNISLKDNRYLTLEDLLGANYIDKITTVVHQDIAERMKDPNNMFFESKPDLSQKKFDFYIDQQGKVVIVFNKAEIAPGYMGIQEFVMP